MFRLYLGWVVRLPKCLPRILVLQFPPCMPPADVKPAADVRYCLKLIECLYEMLAEVVAQFDRIDILLLPLDR